MSIGDEVTELLGVTKYEPPMPAVLAGDAKGLFPSFIQKTDQERIQNLYDDYKSMYADEEFEVTVKLDGSSATYYFKDGEFGVCSRNLELKETEGNSFLKVSVVKTSISLTSTTLMRVGIFHQMSEVQERVSLLSLLSSITFQDFKS
jgi:RNA ligase (TIGR02306 family)